MKRLSTGSVYLAVCFILAVPAFSQTIDERARGLTVAKAVAADGPHVFADCTTSAIPITPPVTIQGSLKTTSCTDILGLREDVYSFNAQAGQTVTIDYYSTAYEVFLYMYLNNGTSADATIVSTLSSGKSEQKIVHTFAASGKYYIETESLFSANSSQPSTGAYTLTVSLTTGGGGNTGTTSQIVPVAGHLNGVAQFRTDLKLFNPNSSTFNGSLVFTPWGQSQSSSDPSVRVTIGPNSVTFFNDVYLMAYPGGTGAARVAIVPDSTSPTKLIVDSSTYTANADGSELAQTPTVLTPSSFSSSGARLVGLVGKSGERTNIFIMTGSSDATITWTYRDANGVASSSITKTYLKDSTTQTAAATLLGFTPAANASIEARIDSGSARVALSPVNNINNQGRWVDFTSR